MDARRISNIVLRSSHWHVIEFIGRVRPEFINGPSHTQHHRPDNARNHSSDLFVCTESSNNPLSTVTQLISAHSVDSKWTTVAVQIKQQQKSMDQSIYLGTIIGRM